MESFLSHLTQIRTQLAIQQSSINESLSLIDLLIVRQLNMPLTGNLKASDTKDYSSSIKIFPKGISSKRDKLKHLLSIAKEPMSAKEIKKQLIEYGENLPNVDQSLVNLERDKLILSKVIDGRKKYFMKKMKSH
jgi:hypothetical protein